MRLLLCLLVLISPTTMAASQWDNVDRIVAVGDVHGAYPRLVSLLKSVGIIDDNLAWVGGRTHLVSLGDFLDRGPESRRVMDLFMRLQGEALQSDGRFHVLLGNHEVMNLTGDLRDVSSAEHTALLDLGGHAASFSTTGKYGRWLVRLPFVIRINRTIFAHGGFPAMISDLGIDAVNEQAGIAMLTVLREGERLREVGALDPNTDLMIAALGQDTEQQAALGEEFLGAINSPLLGGDGPLWYRGTAACHALLESDRLHNTLTTLGVDRAVVGHTPTPDREINKRLDGRAYIIDTGMLETVYKGHARALDIRGDLIQAFGVNGEAAITSQPQQDPLKMLNQPEYAAKEGENNTLTVEFAPRGPTGRFVKMSKRDAKRAVAAYRLDRLLGLNMVPATVQRKINGYQGVVMAWSERPLSERERQLQQRAKPNYCEQYSDFALLAAFDALLGKRDRSIDNLLYDRRTWQIRITENHRAFGTNTGLPTYAKQPTLPPPMARALAGLNKKMLEPVLGNLLKGREISTLLKRRDAILQWPDSAQVVGSVGS